MYRKWSGAEDRSVTKKKRQVAIGEKEKDESKNKREMRIATNKKIRLVIIEPKPLQPKLLCYSLVKGVYN